MNSSAKYDNNFVNNLKEEVKVYGSKFDFDGYAQMNGIIDKNTKIVITTNYQRVFNKIESGEYHILIDEASKSPLHIPFQSMANEILKEKAINGSISIVGDPKQAISLSEYYRGNRKRFLMMEYFLRGLMGINATDMISDGDILIRAKKELGEKRFVFLDTTFRLPGPTHNAISNGYYDRQLKAKKDVKALNIIDKIDKTVLTKLKDENSLLQKVGNTIQNAIESSMGMCLFLDENKNSYKEIEGLLYDQKRGEYGVAAAVINAAITGEPTAVISTYVDQYLQMRMSPSDIISVAFIPISPLRKYSIMRNLFRFPL